MSVEKATSHFNSGRFYDCLDELQHHPDHTDALLLKGICLQRLNKNQEAIETFEALVAIEPNSYEAFTRLANLYKNRQTINRAIACALKAVELCPNAAEGYGVLGACWLYVRDTDQAIDAFQKSVEIAPSTPEFHHNLGLAYQMAKMRQSAIEQFRCAIQLAPSRPQSYLMLAKEYQAISQPGLAIECLQQGIQNAPGAHSLHSAIASAYSSIRNEVAAEHHHKLAVTLSASAKPAYASWLVNQGSFEAATQIYEGLIAENPRDCIAYYGVMQARKLRKSDDHLIDRMENVLSSGPLGAMSELHLRYALGKACEQAKGYERAIVHYDAANNLAFHIHNSAAKEDRGAVTKNFLLAKSAYQQLPSSGFSGQQQPIFIVGMIRSGTTLLEQIVSSHPLVSGAGELRFWIEEGWKLAHRGEIATSRDLTDLANEYVGYVQLLTADTSHFTDKMPINFPYLGLILKTFPQAKILHIRRHPIDTCLSIYTTYFGQGPEFAYNRSNIVSYYKEYEHIMSDWQSILPEGSICEISYEALISSPEANIRRIIDFCELPWDDRCLHHESNMSTIATPSRWQARQPIYTSSAQRWKNFEPHLGEFANLLP